MNTCTNCGQLTANTWQRQEPQFDLGDPVCRLCDYQNSPAYFARRESRKRQAVRKGLV